MSWAKGKSPGWTAFDLKQRQKQGRQPQVDKDPYPPMPTPLASLRACQNFGKHHDVSSRSFSSLLLPSVDLDFEKPVQVGDSSGKHGNKVVDENNHDLAFKKLKGLHGWADNSLIEDIMAAVDNNINKASRLLESMVSTESTEENKETKIADHSSTIGDFPCNKKADKKVSFGKDTDIDDLSSTLEDGLTYSFNELKDLCASCGKILSDDAADMELILQRLRSIPVEPEWEEDDVYLTHRKDAIRMMRSASQHSRAASNAFLRGDHLSSQKYSLKAREEWLAVERLNAKAAKEILSIRNSNNDMWNLDLHGLHAAEAVQALQEHLHKIETHMPMNRSVSPNRVQAKNRIVCSSSLESFSCMETENLDKQQTSFRRQPTSLQVITGIGNHSRGQAALPTAVRSFLNENRYYFDEPRPGVITVRPRFRHT